MEKTKGIHSVGAYVSLRGKRRSTSMMPESAASATVPRLIKESRRDQAVRDGRCMFLEAGVKQLKSKLQRAAVM